MAVYGYVRVSGFRQVKEGESLDVQTRQLQGYAMQHGWTLETVFREEGVSGSVPLAERPEGRKLLDVLKSGDVVCASKLDRVFRSALDALQMTEALKARGVSLHLLDLGGDVSGNGLSKLFLTVAAAFAEAEKHRIQERVVLTKRDQKKRHRYLGGVVPLAREIAANGTLAVVHEHADLLNEAVEMRRAGETYRTIQDWLEGAGMTVSLGALNKVFGTHGLTARQESADTSAV